MTESPGDYLMIDPYSDGYALGDYRIPSKKEQQQRERNSIITCPFCGWSKNESEFPISRSLSYICSVCKKQWHWCSGKDNKPVLNVGTFNCPDCGLFRTHDDPINLTKRRSPCTSFINTYEENEEQENVY